jgi:predicted nucleic acid-binding protein
MKEAEDGKVLLRIVPLVVAELVWVLKSYYKHPLADIERELSAFLIAPGLEVEERDVVLHALKLAATKNVAFTDGYLSARAVALGEEVVTFDEGDFKKLPAPFRVPK